MTAAEAHNTVTLVEAAASGVDSVMSAQAVRDNNVINLDARKHLAISCLPPKLQGIPSRLSVKQQVPVRNSQLTRKYDFQAVVSNHSVRSHSSQLKHVQ